MKILQEILIKSLILSNKNNNLEKPFKTRKTNTITPSSSKTIEYIIVRYEVRLKCTQKHHMVAPTQTY